MIKTILFTLIILLNAIFLFRLIQDLTQNKSLWQKEQFNPLFLSISSFIIFFLSSLGISDFALATLLYRRKNYLADKLLPGTLNTQCVIPVAFMAIAFISTIQVDMSTLFTCIIAQVLGAYLGPRFIVNFSEHTIRLFIGVSLLIATVLIILSKLHFMPSGGNAIGLHGVKLFIAAALLFVFGALNNIGIGSYPLTMLTLYTLGMTPVAAFPIMMGAATFAVPISSIQFIKYGCYSRKITLSAASFGVLGVLIGVYFVKSLDLSLLQWILAAVLLYSGLGMLMQEIRARRNTIPSNHYV